jgi:hypothetical protein
MSRALARTERIANDAYYTPDDVALKCVRSLAGQIAFHATLLDEPRPIERVLEPSVGGGAFARAARAQFPGAEITGIDIEDAPGANDCDRFVRNDFLDCRFMAHYRYQVAIGNPPFGQAQEHIEHTLKMPGIAWTGFLLRLAFLESEKRRAFWLEHKPYSVHVLTRRPSFMGGATDSAAYGWFVWRSGPSAQPTLGWL